MAFLSRMFNKKRMSKELLEASKDGREGDVRRLIERGVDINAVDWYGQTALHLASFYGHVNIVNILLTAGAGANVNAVDKDDWTALHFASQEGHKDVVNLLLTAGADVNAVTMYGSTALHLASDSGHVDTVNLLLAAGVDVNAVNKLKETALDIARRKGHQDVVNVLLAHLDKVNVQSQKRVIVQQTTGATAAVSAGATAVVAAGATAAVTAGETAAVTAGATAGATAAVTGAKLKSVKVSNKQPVDIVKPPVERDDDIGVLTQEMAQLNRGRLPEADLRTLQHFHLRLRHGIVPFPLIDHLFQRGVINDDELDVIKKALDKGRAEGVEKMLEFLHFSGRDAFRLFLECLEQENVGYKDLANELKHHRYARVQADINTLQHFHDRLRKDVFPVPLINHLFQKDVINLDEMDIIKKGLEKGRVVGMEKMLEILHFSREDDFRLFLACLVNVGYKKLASELREHRYGGAQP